MGWWRREVWPKFIRRIQVVVHLQTKDSSSLLRRKSLFNNKLLLFHLLNECIKSWRNPTRIVISITIEPMRQIIRCQRLYSTNNKFTLMPPRRLLPWLLHLITALPSIRQQAVTSERWDHSSSGPLQQFCSVCFL